MTVEPSEQLGACWECGYSLRGLESRRCPECGRPFDPDDPTTMNMGISVRPFAKWLMRPPAAPMYVLTGLAALTSLWAAAAPVKRGALIDHLSYHFIGYGRMRNSLEAEMGDLGSPYGRFLWGALLWSLVAAGWILRRVARGVTVRRLSKHKAATFAYWWRWLVPLVALGATVLVCTTRLPMLAGFWISRPWLDRTAHGALAPGATAPAGGWIGVYPPPRLNTLAQIHAGPGEVWIFTSQNSGFVYIAPGPRRRPPSLRWIGDNVEQQPIGGNWHAFGTK